mgnify:CR=1 FL=1
MNVVKFTKERMFINHKIGERRNVMRNYESLIEKEKNLAKFYAWYGKLNDTEREFYTRGFIQILAGRIGLSAILCLIAGFVIGYLI